jgi:predicted AAA+ superfamily ATPase
LPAWHRNIKKQIVKAPKLQFFDSGLLCYLLSINAPSQLRHHPLRGAVFETWVFSEYYKKNVHRGENPQLFHYRESRGLEVDLLQTTSDKITLIESKSGETIGGDYFDALEALEVELTKPKAAVEVDKVLVYGGDESMTRHGVRVIAWNALG